MMADHKSVTRMLKTARGQIDGILRMVDEDRYCVDISTQLMATQALIARINADVLKAHIEGNRIGRRRPQGRQARRDRTRRRQALQVIGALGTDCFAPSWCIGDRYVCTTLVQIDLSPLL